MSVFQISVNSKRQKGSGIAGCLASSLSCVSYGSSSASQVLCKSLPFPFSMAPTKEPGTTLFSRFGLSVLPGHFIATSWLSLGHTLYLLPTNPTKKKHVGRKWRRGSHTGGKGFFTQREVMTIRQDKTKSIKFTLNCKLIQWSANFLLSGWGLLVFSFKKILPAL